MWIFYRERHDVCPILTDILIDAAVRQRCSGNELGRVVFSTYFNGWMCFQGPKIDHVMQSMSCKLSLEFYTIHAFSKHQNKQKEKT